jgi:Tol biopolymer transport system component
MVLRDDWTLKTTSKKEAIHTEVTCVGKLILHLSYFNKWQIEIHSKVMKSKIFLGLTIILIVIQSLSCKKETSCEGCKESNEPPIAIAGPDQVITLPTDSVSLDGSSSSDPDGTISEWLWKKISGPAFNFNSTAQASITVKNLIKGVYQFELKVTDDKNLSTKDTVEVVVNDLSQSNSPPEANVRADQTITLPTNTIFVDGVASIDPDNNITGYSWQRISGPIFFNIVNANAVQTQITNLVQGIYQFELKVTDAGGLFSKDTLQVIVNGQQSPTSPACNNCKIVFVSDRDGNNEIYSCNSDGSNIIRLTYDAGIDDQPTWSPDNTRIAFMSDRAGTPEIYIMNTDGSNVVRKTFAGAAFATDPAWSPDGTKICYSTVNNGSMNIWVMNVASGSTSLLFEAPGYDVQPAWSPDGTKIALVSDWMAYDFVYDIYIINADGTGFTALTGNIFDYVDYLHPSWSPNGTKLAMAISQTIGIDQYSTQVGIMNPDGSGITVLASNAAAWTKTSWSGDSTKIAYTSMSGSRKDISWVSVNGSSQGTIVTNGWNADWRH